MPDVTADQIRRILPSAGAQADAYAGPLNTAMTAHGITTPEQRSAFIAQVGVESGDLLHTTENLNYSAARLEVVWPHRFPDLASAEPYANNPEKLGNFVYAGRFGNGDVPSGDGFRFRGRGLMQVTFRENYHAVGFDTNPDDLAQPAHAADSAAKFWESHGLNVKSQAECNRAQFDAITLVVNGGLNGADLRWAVYQRALSVLRAPATAG